MGYPRGWEPGETGNKFCTIAQYLAIEKHTEAGATKAWFSLAMQA